VCDVSAKRWVYLCGLFAFAFVYMFAASVILREIIIPEVFPHSANGHQPGDPSFYDFIAKRNVDNFMEGKAKLSFSPHGQTVAGIASYIYAYGGSIYSLVLLNCILHGASVVILFLILSNWFSSFASTVGVAPLLISPYMILWFSQINKGSWTLLGVLLFTYGFIKFLSLQDFCSRRALVSTAQMFLGLLSIQFVRPYMIELLFPAVALISLLSCFRFYKWKLTPLLRLGPIFMMLTLISFSGFLGISSQQTVSQAIEAPTLNVITDSPLAERCFKNIENWQNVEILPSFVNNRLRGMMEQRCRIFVAVKGDRNLAVLKSIFDADWMPKKSLEAVYHIPVSFFRGVLSPAPWSLGLIIKPEFSIFYLMSIFESCLMWVGLVGLFFWVVRSNQFSLWALIICSFSVMTMFAMSIPFYGALYRYRYPFWILLIGLGLAACSDLLSRRSVAAKQKRVT